MVAAARAQDVFGFPADPDRVCMSDELLEDGFERVIPDGNQTLCSDPADIPVFVGKT